MHQYTKVAGSLPGEHTRTNQWARKRVGQQIHVCLSLRSMDKNVFSMNKN